MMAQGNNDEAEAAKEQVRAINEKIAALSEKRDEAEDVYKRQTIRLPGTTSPDGATLRYRSTPTRQAVARG